MGLKINGIPVAGVGKPGKSAYQSAVDGGFLGTEEEFNRQLAKSGGGYSKEETLSKSTKMMYGLGEDATPNTVFQKLAMPYGYYGFDVTVVTEDGIPVPNVFLKGLEDFNKNIPATDENGRYALAVADTATPTLTINNHIGIMDYETTLTANDEYVFTPVTITVTKNSENISEINTSGIYSVFAPEGTTVDISIIGAGGSGAASLTRGSAGVSASAGGGAGGYITTLYDVPIKTNTTLTCTIGAGGELVTGTTAGNAGGSTICFIDEVEHTSLGGEGGMVGDGQAQGGGLGGNHNGNNPPQLNEVNNGYLFDETSGTQYGSGGGGAYAFTGQDSEQNLYGSSNSSTGASGAGNGSGVQKGGYFYAQDAHAVATSAITYGSGGGAAAAVYSNSNNRTGSSTSGAGMSGAVFIRRRGELI